MAVKASAAHVIRRLGAVRRDDLVAVWWAFRVFPAVRRDLEAVGTAVQVSAPPPGLSRWAGRSVLNFLALRKATCLERSVVMQRWLIAQGTALPVIIGVGKRDDVFAAHAWLPGFDAEEDLVGFSEISRIEPYCV